MRKVKRKKNDIKKEMEAQYERSVVRNQRRRGRKKEGRE